MYLKRLESVGFKSFAERVNVDFVPGVTAVVGPNGSGKSNITDALRWVLGEQSAKSLRGAKMEDIIFQGSDTRKPLNVAEVSLVLDNSDHTLPLDYDEINVTRRAFRSGESEFYLNQQPCRLKDIVDLFMDSGLGKEAFSIISQGKVEEILSSKPDDRRTIFEEAAGVLKYKQRKKKSEYKLSETQENLNRVEDIIYEMEQQMDPLREQAETAQEYLKQKEQLKEQEISLLIAEIEQLHGEWQSLLAEIDSEKQNELQLKTEIQQKEANVEAEKQSIQDFDERIEVFQSSLLSITQELEQFEGKKRLLDERTKHFSENKTELEARRQEVEKRLEETKQVLAIEQEKLQQLTDQHKETKQKTEQLKKQLDTDEENIADKIEVLKSDYIEYLNEQAAKRNENQSIQQQLQQITVKKDKQDAKFNSLLTDREEFTDKQKAISQKLSKRQKNYREKEASIQELKNNLEKHRHELQSSQEKLNQSYQYIEKLKSKKEMLEEMKEDFQGFFNGVKSVLKARDEQILNAIYGAVIELVDVPKPYITAIETVLGGQAQHIVVENDTAARNAISWLKQTNNGRASFLPLASIGSRYVIQDVLAKVKAHQGYVGIAADLVSYAKTYEKAVHHLMGHVLIAETLKDAGDIAQIARHKFRVVTLEGDVVNPGGSMSGGARKKSNRSLFTRDKDLQSLTNKLTAFQASTVDFETQTDKEKQTVEQLETDLKEKQDELEAERIALQDIKSKQSEVKFKQESLNDSLKLYDQDKRQYDQDVEQLKQRDTQLNDELTEIERKLAAINEQMDTLEAQNKTFKDNREQLQQDYHACQVTLAEQDERLKSQQEKTENSKQQLQKLTEQHNQYKNKLAELTDSNENEITEEEITERIQSKQAEKEQITEKIQEMRTQRNKRTQWIQDQEREIKEKNKHHQAFLTMIKEKEVKANRLDVELENRLSHLQTEYTLTFERARDTYQKAENLDETKHRVEQIKQTIDRLGNVNLGAIDEHERISERYTFLSEQKNDLVEAKQTLNQVISEMDAEMESRFSSTFSQIKQEFTDVFKELFGGGRAELTLTEPENLLDTGVDIDAEPPGKKLQHIGLLSGGERALTAIALLFAILRVRPVPFCVLDEVEAALDEANVVRFAQYVQMYSKETQFIVITHRKATMEESDVLYGVTMQEAGVSRFVSVRLEDTEELITT